jgi:alkylated DNA repair dioxygenase AlkB
MPGKKPTGKTPARKSELPGVSLPEGFLYFPDFLAETEESELLRAISTLEFRPFDFHGYIARRRIVEYGWEYDFSSRKAAPAAAIPHFLSSIRERAATLASIEPDSFIEAVITDYPPGAPIGWHRDVPQFVDILGVSLGGRCRMRFKPYKGEGKIASMVLEPRSLYVIRGPARWNFQHSIPAVEQQRYSITFRTARQRKPKTLAT